MPDDSKDAGRARRDDIYRLIRIDTERAVNRLLTSMRERSDDAVDQYMGSGGVETDDAEEPTLTEADLEKISDIRLTHSTAFAHALLQGAADAFEDHKAGLSLLKRLIDVEIAELEQEARFVRDATSTGSKAIN